MHICSRLCRLCRLLMPADAFGNVFGAHPGHPTILLSSMQSQIVFLSGANFSLEIFHPNNRPNPTLRYHTLYYFQQIPFKHIILSLNNYHFDNQAYANRLCNYVIKHKITHHIWLFFYTASRMPRLKTRRQAVSGQSRATYREAPSSVSAAP